MAGIGLTAPAKVKGLHVTREEWLVGRRREMLWAYHDAIKNEGLQGASLTKIARRLDIPHSLLIHHFRTKEDMTVALVELILEEYEKSYTEQFASIDDPLERLTKGILALFTVDFQEVIDEQVFYACFYLSMRGERVRRCFDALDARLRGGLSEAIATCIAAGVLPPGDADELAEYVMALEEGYSYMAARLTDRRERARLGGRLVRHALDALGVPPFGRPPGR